jgi:hemoglobin
MSGSQEGAQEGAQGRTTPLDLLGGQAAVRGLVDRFYDLMDLEPGFALLRSLHPASLEDSRDKLFWFLCGWLGGPPLYEDRFGHPRLRARHMPYSIGIAERDQWMVCMVQAMTEQGLSLEWIERLTTSFHNTADWMRNRGV